MRYSPAAVLVAVLALPVAAHADSISYIRDGNVWLAAGDGSRQTQVTTSGAFSMASQGDDGTLVAISGRRLYRLDRGSGAILNEINTPLGPGWYGPWEPAVSPDGTHVAYEIRDWQGSPAVAYSNTDGSLESRPLQTGWTWPTWIDNTWLLHSEAPNPLSKDLIVRALGQPNNEGEQWFKDEARTPLADVDLRGDLFAGITNDTLLSVYRFTGRPGEGAADGCIQLTGPTGKFSGPAFSPDARSLVWGEGDGLWRTEMPAPGVACKDSIVQPRLIVAGGANPDWSPAGVPAIVRRQDPPPPPPVPPVDSTPKPQPVPGPAPAKMTLSASRQTLKAALKRGLTVKLANATAKTKVTATYKRQVVAGGTGTTTVKLEFTPRGAKALKRKRKVTLTLKAGSVTKTITLS